LPDCALRRVLSFLPAAALCAAARVCMRWAALCVAPPLLPAWLDASPAQLASWAVPPPAVAAFMLCHAPSAALLAGPDLPNISKDALRKLHAARFPPSSSAFEGAGEASTPHRGRANAFLASLLRQEALMHTCNVPVASGGGGGACPTAVLLHPSAAVQEVPRGPHAPLAECTHAGFLRTLLHLGAPHARRTWFRRDVGAGVSEARRLETLHANYACVDIFQHRAGQHVPASLPAAHAYDAGAGDDAMRVPVPADAEAGAEAFSAHEERLAVVDWRGPLRVYIWYRVGFLKDAAVADGNADTDADADAVARAAARAAHAAAVPPWQRNAYVETLLCRAAAAGALSGERVHATRGTRVIGRALLFCAVDGAEMRIRLLSLLLLMMCLLTCLRRRIRTSGAAAARRGRAAAASLRRCCSAGGGPGGALAAGVCARHGPRCADACCERTGVSVKSKQASCRLLRRTVCATLCLHSPSKYKL
jgi:hypothetical protein